MFRSYVLRGAKAGLVAGLAFGLFVALVGNPLIAAAEGGLGDVGTEGHDHAAGGSHDHGAGEHHDHGAGAVSATVTDLVGVASAVLWGLLLGLAFGVAYFFLEPTLPDSALGGRLALAGAGFATVSGAPWLVLPPGVPGVEAALPTEARLALYAGAMVAGALASGAALLAWRRLRPRGRGAGVAGALAPFGALGLITAAFPFGGADAVATGALGRTVAGVVILGQVGLWSAIAFAHDHISESASGTATSGLDGLDDELTAPGR